MKRKSTMFRYMLIQTLSGMEVSLMLSVEKMFAKKMRTINKIAAQFFSAYLKKHILSTSFTWKHFFMLLTNCSYLFLKADRSGACTQELPNSCVSSSKSLNLPGPPRLSLSNSNNSNHIYPIACCEEDISLVHSTCL